MVKEAVIQCEYCEKRFMSSAAYNSHKKKSHRVKKWSCEFCNRRFAERGTLTNHRRTHTKETPFGCETCGRRFSHRATLLNHRKTHNKFRKYGCQHCGKRFHRKSNMNRHIQVVHLGKQHIRRRRDLKPMHFRSSVPPPMFASDSSSDASPIQGPMDVKMPPPPLPVDLVLRQMGFPQNLTQGHIAAMNPTYTSHGGNMPERVTLSVTYEQNQIRRASLTAQPQYQVPPAVSFQMPALPNLSVARTRGPVTFPGVPPPLTFERCKIECGIKEEPIDSYAVPAAPPSLEHSRSNSPIIIGCDDYMMKDEVHTPSPMMQNGGAKLFSWVSKPGEVTARLPTPIHAGSFAFPGSNGVKQEIPDHVMGPGVPVGQETKPAVQKKDSIPDKLKLKLDSFPMSDYLASQMVMTIQKPDGVTSNIALSAPSPRTTILME